jgi:hemerythrin
LARKGEGMSDYLAKVSEILEEHRTIRSNVKLVGDSVSDQEALASLKGMRSAWTPGRLEMMSERQLKLTQTMSFLEEGLRNHFSKEEEVLPQVLGEFLMRALLSEHQEIKGAISRVKAVAGATELEGMSQEELTAHDSELRQVVNSLSQLIEGHADKEDMMLEMVERAIEAGK